MNNNGNTGFEINIFYLIKKLWNKKFLIIFVTLFCAALAFLGTLFLIKPTYTATTRFYIVNQSSDNLTPEDLQAVGYLVNDYKEIIVSRDVLADAIEKEDASLSPGELSGMVLVSVPSDTRVISISVEGHNAKEAAGLANAVRQSATEKIKTVTKIEDITVLEEAEEPARPSSPSVKRNLVLGGAAGAFLAIVGVLLLELVNDRVKDPDDIEEILGLPLLGVIPNTEKM
ncbi:capsular biosynthesis protein CpsC [Streptococcus chenjunshii]|uniref:Capsular polysaccharide biosynthesis protein CpsC n=1 Tax=Streptococcus chenjunshii TaxID=2173853 RepID=A0A372KPK8_9STRE|nr:Wzz/FepE/Etk N-terminal domain-containing protein [Streptococcus chenjunshii]AXQ78528.1 capsular biosynthesis protein CpsC [Streptococcus chenjunshii]RFU52010.1 capsular biosynthesis protein CpsC [Streptococcus chenjunshii]RFU54202.1 capsular biosynthesis protein CpsC [Streptococcus chenjunshii]